MKIIDKKGISGIIQKMLYLILTGGILIMVSLPFILKYILMSSLNVKYINTESFWYFFIIIFLEISGVFAALIIIQALLLFKNINDDNPFSGKSYIYLKRTSLFCLIESILYLVKIILFNSLFTMVIFMIFIILWLLILVLAELFKKAKDYKDENDLTI